MFYFSFLFVDFTLHLSLIILICLRRDHFSHFMQKMIPNQTIFFFLQEINEALIKKIFYFGFLVSDHCISRSQAFALQIPQQNSDYKMYIQKNNQKLYMVGINGYFNNKSYRNSLIKDKKDYKGTNKQKRGCLQQKLVEQDKQHLNLNIIKYFNMRNIQFYFIKIIKIKYGRQLKKENYIFLILIKVYFNQTFFIVNASIQILLISISILLSRFILLYYFIQYYANNYIYINQLTFIYCAKYINQKLINYSMSLQNNSAANLDIQEEYKLLYRVWCRIFYNDICESNVKIQEKNKKCIVHYYHVAILDHIIANDHIILDDIKKINKQWEPPIEQLKHGLLLIEINKLIRLNPMFLQNVSIIISNIQKYIQIEMLLCKSNQQQCHLLICASCFRKHDSYIVEMTKKYICQNCGSIALRRPLKNLEEFTKCENLLKKIQRFQKLKQQIQSKVLNKNKQKKNKQNKLQIQKRTKSRLQQIFEKSLRNRESVTIDIEQKQILRKYLKQNVIQEQFSKKFFKQNVKWPKKMKSILKKRLE